METWFNIPFAVLFVQFGVAALFLGAAAHKFKMPTEFRSVLKGYRIIPAGLEGLSGTVIPSLELLVAALVLVRPDWGLLIAAGLLAGYALAMLSALVRGLSNIDCGCSWGARKDEEGSLGSWQIIRNICLVGLCFFMAGRSSESAPHMLDYITAIGALGIAVLMNSVIPQLRQNARWNTGGING